MNSLYYGIIVFLILPLCLLSIDNNHFTCFIYYFLLSLLNVYYLKREIVSYGLLYLLSPSFLTVTYISYNCIFGSFFFSQGWILNTYFLDVVKRISERNLCYLTIYMGYCICSLCIVSKNYSKIIKRYKIKQDNKKKPDCIDLFLPFILLVLLVIAHSFSKKIFDIGLSVFSFELGAVIYITYLLIKIGYSFRKRLLIYVSILTIIFLLSYESKREAFFILFSVFLIETATRNNHQIKIKHIIWGSLIGFLLAMSILLSSLMRGYGNFEGSYREALYHIPEYIRSDNFYAMAANNFEFGYDYGHTVNAINYCYEGKIPILYGETFFKVLFLPLPKSIFEYKPNSMVHIYTTVFDPIQRKMGGSYPVMICAEFYANFYLLGLILMILLYSFFDKVYFLLYRDWNRKSYAIFLFKIAFFSLLLQFVRGSGLDLTIYNLSLATIVILMMMKLSVFSTKH